MLGHSPLVLLLVQAMAVIVAGRLLGRVARRIQQPLVIAEVVAGIALGPSLLGWLAPRLSAEIFPPASFSTLGLVAQMGLVLFMFLVGLEFDPELLKGRTHTSVVISHTSIVVPFGLGALIALWLYGRLSDASVSFTSFALFMGVAMSITAFPVLARILVERHLLKTTVGSIAIACAAVDDVTAWCILAFVVSVARATGLGTAALTTAMAIGYIAVMLLLVRPLLNRLAERSRTREVLTQDRIAVVLVLVLLSSTATELIGIHALFGAFILGAVIPKAQGFARLMAEKIEDLVVVMLLPLFFAYSGLRTQIGLLQGSMDWAMCGLIIVVACVGKFGGSVVAARLTGLRWREASAIGVLMNTRGLMELVVLNIGLDLGVISPKLFTMMVLMALVTTFMTTPLLEWIYPMSELTRDLLREPTAAVAEAGYAVVMCVSDPRSGPGMVRLAKALDGTQLTALQLARAERISGVMAEGMDKKGGARSAAPLGPLMRTAKEMKLDVRPLSFVSTQPARDISSVAAAKRADLLLLGWHKPLVGGTVLGGVVADVLRQAPADVGIFVDRGLTTVRRVLVPYLRGDNDVAAVRVAHRLATRTGVAVTVLHVVPPDENRRGEVEREVVELTEASPQGETPVTMKIVPSDDPALAALEESREDYDLVIIGVGAHWHLEQRLFGLQSEVLVEQCPRSMLIVRGGSALRALAEAEALDPRSRSLVNQGV